MARPASAHPALVPILTLLVGLAAGWATNPFSATPSRAGEPLRGAAPSAELDAPRDALRAPTSETAGEAERTRAAVEAPPTAAATVEEPAPPGEPAPASLVAELSALLRSGRIESALSSDAQRLLRYTVEAYLAAKAPREALALLDRHPELESNHYARVGYMLLNEGDREGAVAAFLRKLERGGAEAFDVDDLSNLANVDPAAALAFLESRSSELDPFLQEQLRAQRARLLSLAGRTDESLALLRQLSADGSLDAEALGALESLPDETAEAFLREALAGNSAEDSTVALAALLGRTQRQQEGAELLRALLARRPEHLEALSTLFTLDAQASLAHVAASGLDLPPNLWSQAGNALQSQGRTGEAVDAWMRAFEGDPSDWETGDALRANAPALLWAHAERLAATTQDDEVLGDLADLNWRDGRTEQALELWRRARSLDPGDSEWSGKLRAVALGKDPL
jgi:tetratricopeptide (TPR) repeat protein